MSLFSRRPSQPALPADIVQMMERYGRYEIGTRKNGDTAAALSQTTQQPLVQWASTEPAGFMMTLADACIPAGGWATYGAERTVLNLVATPQGPDWDRLLDATIAFLRANYVPPIRVDGYAWERFLALGGTSSAWVALRTPPPRDVVRITPLAEGEVRPLVKIDPAPDSNMILLSRQGEHFVATIDSRQSDEDPTRSQFAWKRNTDIYDLYRDVAWDSQIWDWADPELEPFFPAPKALI